MQLKRLVIFLVMLMLSSCGGQGGYTGAPAGQYALNVSVTGLGVNQGNSVVIQNNNSSTLTFTSDSTQTFYLANGSSYNVEVANQPSPLICNVISGAGSASSAVNVSVVCRPQYVFVTNYAASSLTVLALGTRNQLTQVSLLPTGSNPTRVKIHPSGAFAYVANYSSASISVFSVASGSLTSLGSQSLANGEGPVDLAITPDGHHLYCLDENYGTIVGFSVSSTGQLTQASTTSTLGAGASSMVIDSTGTYAYVSSDSPNPRVYSYQIMGDGSLQPISNLSNGLIRPTSIVLSPSGKNAYVVDAGTNRVLIFSVNNGFLNQISSVQTGNVPQSIALTPSGRFAYVTNYGLLSNGSIQGTTLSQYSVDGAGLLTAMTPSTVLAGNSNSAGPFAIAVDQTGSVVLNTNYNENDIALNVIGASGSLAANPVEFFNTNISEPTSIAIY